MRTCSENAPKMAGEFSKSVGNLSENDREKRSEIMSGNHGKFRPKEIGHCEKMVGNCWFLIGYCEKVVGHCARMVGHCAKMVGICAKMVGKCIVCLFERIIESLQNKKTRFVTTSDAAALGMPA